jgi:HSP20 family molecular chaperone IbpA
MDWMLSEAIGQLARAERIQRQFFRLGASQERTDPSWEPPVDVLETKNAILIFVALPGVDPEMVETVIEGDTIVISGRRELPGELREAHIHRLELPQGRFERRITLPGGSYDVSRSSANGHVLIRLAKST